jgi:transposase
LVFLDESGFLLQPLRRKIWAPVGQTPIHYPWDRHDRLSVLCALTVAPWQQRFGLYYELLDHNCHADDMIRFLQAVHRSLRRTMLVIWDRLNVHRSAAAQLAQAGCSWLEPRWLPAYAPELDPVEFVWTQAKYGDLANWIPDDIHQLRVRLQELLEEYRHDPDRLYSFFRTARLPI